MTAIAESGKAGRMALWAGLILLFLPAAPHAQTVAPRPCSQTSMQGVVIEIPKCREIDGRWQYDDGSVWEKPSIPMVKPFKLIRTAKGTVGDSEWVSPHGAFVSVVDVRGRAARPVAPSIDDVTKSVFHKGNGFLNNKDRDALVSLDRYFSNDLIRSWEFIRRVDEDALPREDVAGGGAWGTTGGQITTTRVSTPKPGAAIVRMDRMRFEDGASQPLPPLHYDMVLEQGGWRIDDIRGPSYSLRERLVSIIAMVERKHGVRLAGASARAGDNTPPPTPRRPDTGAIAPTPAIAQPEPTAPLPPTSWTTTVEADTVTIKIANGAGIHMLLSCNRKGERKAEVTWVDGTKFKTADRMAGLIETSRPKASSFATIGRFAPARTMFNKMMGNAILDWTPMQGRPDMTRKLVDPKETILSAHVTLFTTDIPADIDPSQPIAVDWIVRAKAHFDVTGRDAALKKAADNGHICSL